MGKNKTVKNRSLSELRQVKTDRKIAELEKKVEWLPKNTDRKIENFRKDLPKEIRGVIGHIEFSQNNLR